MLSCYAHLDRDRDSRPSISASIRITTCCANQAPWNDLPKRVYQVSAHWSTYL